MPRIVAGLVPAVHAFAQFAKARGTPMPIAPTEHLVVTRFNQYVHNPMYIGLLLVIAGQAVLFGSLGLVLYGVAAWNGTAAFRPLEFPAASPAEFPTASSASSPPRITGGSEPGPFHPVARSRSK